MNNRYSCIFWFLNIKVHILFKILLADQLVRHSLWHSWWKLCKWCSQDFISHGIDLIFTDYLIFHSFSELTSARSCEVTKPREIQVQIFPIVLKVYGQTCCWRSMAVLRVTCDANTFGWVIQRFPTRQGMCYTTLMNMSPNHAWLNKQEEKLCSDSYVRFRFCHLFQGWLC